MAIANDNNKTTPDPIASIVQVKNGKFLGGRCGTVVTLANGATLEYAPPLSKKEARRQALMQIAWRGIDALVR